MVDYTENELETIRRVLRHRYKQDIEIHLADCEIQPDRETIRTVERPAVFWNAMDCNFIVVKMDSNLFQGRFFYTPDEHFGDNQHSYTDAENCVIALLQNQADQVREDKGVTSGVTGADLN